MDPEKTTPIENNQSVESSNTTPDEILELKKKLAEEFADKLSKKDSGLMTSIMKGVISNYLVDENNPTDILVDNFIGELGDKFGLLPPDIKKYREMFSEADTKNKLELLRKTIFNETGGVEQVSTSDQKPDTPTENSNGLSGETKEDGKEETVNNNGKDEQSAEQPADSKVESNNSIVEKAIQWALNIANDNSYGYELGGTGNGRHGKTGFDCQSLVRGSFIRAGIDVPPSGGCATMRKQFEKVGFEWIPLPKNKEEKKKWAMDNAKKGDIFLQSTKHTELYVGDGKIVGAHSNKDGKPGDSGGEEISVRDIKKSLGYRNPEGILRYKGSVA